MPFSKKQFEEKIKELTPPAKYFVFKKALETRQFLGNTGIVPPHIELNQYYENAVAHVAKEEDLSAAGKYFTSLKENNSQLASSDTYKKVAETDAENHIKNKMVHEDVEKIPAHVMTMF
ncbi:MAG: hypothetical protein P4M12_04105 [Gammaproteobacteria bacterium]|nr:hypothetical protein [Gammaproteobacteria bacterium]